MPLLGRAVVSLALMAWWLVGANSGAIYGGPCTDLNMCQNIRIMYHNNHGNPGEALLCEEEDY